MRRFNLKLKLLHWVEGLALSVAGTILTGMLVPYCPAGRTDPETEVRHSFDIGGLTQSEIAQELSVSCRDESGNMGQFDVFLISFDYSWDCGNESEIVIKGEPASLEEFFRGNFFQERLKHAEELVAVGTASCEMTGEGEVGEKCRAYRRARHMQRVLNETWKRGHVRGNLHDIHLLNLGKHKDAGATCDDCSNATSDQRRLILLAIADRDPSLDLEYCLKQLFDEEPALLKIRRRYNTAFEVLEGGDFRRDRECDFRT